MKHDFSLYHKRRKHFLERVKAQHIDVNKGCVVLVAGFEDERNAFRQESSFYYLTGITDPGVALVIYFDGRSCLYVPNYSIKRSVWMKESLSLDQDNAALLGVDSVRFFGDECIGYQTHLLQNDGYYKNFIAYVIDNLNSDYRFFSLYPKTGPDYMQQRVFVDRIINRIPALQKQLCDVSGIVADMRRVKDEQEQNLMQKAVDITMAGYGGVVPHIKHGAYEYQIRAQVECVFAGKVARPSFPTIVGAGKNSTILHYLEGWDQLVDGDLVVIDSGAEYEYYAADLTRTYPVSGKFTERQKEIYNCVLDTQEYIAQKARPGLWLSHKDKPQESLNHMARAYLEKKGYAQYFPHGIGHFLGLDVHDVGDYSKPLQEGDVITIEPGIYIPQESLGVRIEDNYRLVSDGVVCLSGSLPKTVDAIEAMMLG